MTVRLQCLILAAAIALSAKSALNWQECRVKYGERIVTQSQNNTVNLGEQKIGAILANKLAHRDKKVWTYVIDAGAQFYAVESKSALDIDIDATAKYARKGDTFYILDRSGKEKTLKIVRQMSATEAEEMAAKR